MFEPSRITRLFKGVFMENNTLPEKGELIIYTIPDGNILTEVKLENETIWMTEQQIAMVFERDRTVISRHIKNIIQIGELDEKSNMQKMHVPNSDKPVAFYNLDMILSVGYRVNSKRGTSSASRRIAFASRKKKTPW